MGFAPLYPSYELGSYSRHNRGFNSTHPAQRGAPPEAFARWSGSESGSRRCGFGSPMGGRRKRWLLGLWRLRPWLATMAPGGLGLTVRPYYEGLPIDRLDAGQTNGGESCRDQWGGCPCPVTEERCRGQKSPRWSAERRARPRHGRAPRLKARNSLDASRRSAPLALCEGDDRRRRPPRRQQQGCGALAFLRHDGRPLMSKQRAPQKPPLNRDCDDAHDDDPIPDDIDEFRREMVRRIATFLQAWRTCRRPPCKRGRRCAARMPCASLANLRQLPAHQDPAMISNFYRLLQRGVAGAAQRKPGGR